VSDLRASLQEALARLEEVLRVAEDDIVRDAAVQRFEFCFELGWKVVQQALRAEGLDCASPRSCFAAAFRRGWLRDEASGLTMLEDRNRTTHTYDQELAIDVYRRLPKHLAVLRELLRALP